jgi:hypothetical protein
LKAGNGSKEQDKYGRLLEKLKKNTNVWNFISHTYLIPIVLRQFPQPEIYIKEDYIYQWVEGHT